jgi:hypothetical protein
MTVGPSLSIPSVWRESGCCNHYIIRRDRIFLFGQSGEEWDDPSLLQTRPLVQRAEKYQAIQIVLYREVLPVELLIARANTEPDVIHKEPATTRGTCGAHG